VEVSEGETVVSIRTRREDVYDVSKIATQIGVNGGVHRGAAGTTIMKSCEESKKSW
jgi:nanoRNase/pAp phosphatase (c-di-AMP/oligoRNAs hydrolase)